MKFADLWVRKLVATFVATAMSSLFLALLYMGSRSESGIEYELGNRLLSWSAIFMIYTGTIIFVYGNAVSVVLEFTVGRWLKGHHGLYVLLHGVMGLPLGLLFHNSQLAICGMLAAFVYATAEWLLIKLPRNYGVRVLLAVPIIVYGLSWGYLQAQSAPLPPFTIEDAVEFAAGGTGKVVDHFPKAIGRWEGVIDGYHVVRDTSAEKLGSKKYRVTFTESWRKGSEQGSRFDSFTVVRDSLTHHKGEGDTPPYN